MATKKKAAAKRTARTPKKPQRRKAGSKSTPAPRLVADTTIAPWAVSPEQIRILGDSGLNALMRNLLLAQAYRCAADVSKVLVNTEDKAADDGCDGWTPAPPNADPWLAAVETCWQFKAGGAGQPAKLVGEIQKKTPVQTLRAGGRFVAVTSRAGGGKKEEKNRLDALIKGAKKAKLKAPSLAVLTSETLATWANEHPAIAAAIRGMPRGCWTLERWGADSLHKEPWHATATLDAGIATLRKSLDTAAGTATHVHVYGQPGAGKSRFVLEACRGAPWAASVMYIPQASDARVGELLDSVADSASARLVLVVDEVQPHQVSGFNASVRSASGRLRLITIGHDGSPDSTNINELRVEGLDAETMAKVILGWHPDLPKEHVQFVVTFCDGFVKLARLAASAVARDPSIDTTQLMARNDIRQLMVAMLGKAERRRALHVLAVLSSVGWTGKRAAEGEAIAEHLGLDWADVQAEVEAIHAKHGIAPRGGDLRYISPKPLGVYLAIEALAASPEKMRTLPEALPTDAARSAYYDRLRAVVASPSAKAFADEELARFSKWTDFTDALSVERWAALAGADPTTAVQRVRGALEQASHDERLQIASAARRHLVRALVELAWHADAFQDAALGLAELAEAENESWANNATGEFVSKYQLVLGGTACPYLDRLGAIDELLTRGVAYRRVAIAALAKIGGTHEGRWGGARSEGKPLAPEWHASTPDERIKCAHEALDRLARAASSAPEELAEPLLLAVRNVAMLLRQEPVRERVARFLQAVVARLPKLREAVRLEAHRVLNGEKKYWKQLTPDDLAWLERFHGELEDKSPAGQLRQALAQTRWDRSPGEEGNLDSLASKLVAEGQLLAAEWPWLTSGDAVAVWDLGEALGRADTNGVLLEQMLNFDGRGSDLRLVAGYLQERAKREAPGWIDDQIDEAERKNPDDTSLLFQLTWRCAPTTRGAKRLTRYARGGRLQPAMVAHLVYGGWCLSPSIASVAGLLRTIAPIPEFRAGALALVEQRLSKHPEELPLLEDVAVTLVTTNDLLLTGSTGGYSWAQVAYKLVPRHVREIAKTIFACQAHRGDDRWFIEHSEASGVLSSCAAADPSGVWAELEPHLESAEWFLFTIGFPPGILSQLPRADVLAWVEMAPDLRAGMLARTVEKVFSDGTLGAELLHRYRKLDDVGDAFFSAYVTGTWSGSASKHWEHLAHQLDQTAKNSKLSGVRAWASESAVKLRRMAKDDRKREEEERLR